MGRAGSRPPLRSEPEGGAALTTAPPSHPKPVNQMKHVSKHEQIARAQAARLEGIALRDRQRRYGRCPSAVELRTMNRCYAAQHSQ